MENLRRGRKRLNLERRIKWENVRRMLFTSVCFFILFFVAAGVVQIQKLHPIKPLFIWCAALLVETYAVIYGLISYLGLSKIKEIEMKKVLYLFWGTFLVLMAGFSFLVLDHFISLLIYLVASVILALVPLWNRQEFLVLFGMQIFVAAVLAYSKDLCLEEIVYLWANQLLCGIISRQGYYNFQQRMLDATRIDTAKLLSETDPMTQMLNRRGMEGVLNRIWPICEEKHTKVAVLMIDIDN
ncbi:MAG: diguanylate cyclase, partial [Lachnospiraceae bacterium]